MRKYWGHAAMLLLGVSLTVGFYEGRELVQNTAKALSAATTIRASNQRQRERRQDERGREVAIRTLDEEQPLVLPEDRKRRRKPTGEIPPLTRGPLDFDKLGLTRQRRPHRALPGRGAGADLAIPVSPRGKPARPQTDVLDTGTAEPPEADPGAPE